MFSCEQKKNSLGAPRLAELKLHARRPQSHRTPIVAQLRCPGSSDAQLHGYRPEADYGRLVRLQSVASSSVDLGSPVRECADGNAVQSRAYLCESRGSASGSNLDRAAAEQQRRALGLELSTFEIHQSVHCARVQAHSDRETFSFGCQSLICLARPHVMMSTRMQPPARNV